MLKRVYQHPVTEAYRKITRKDLDRLDDTNCIWCNHPLPPKAVMWCTEECHKQYERMAKFEELRNWVHERDVSICEACEEHELHYVVAPRVPLELGGGSAGLDGVRTMCEACMLRGVGAITAQELEVLALPDVAKFRALWRSADKCHRRLRHTLGPTMVSGLQWFRILNEYRKGARHLQTQAVARNREHFRLVMVSKRWWAIVLDNSDAPHPLLLATVDSLKQQYRACTVWAHHFRTKGAGNLE